MYYKSFRQQFDSSISADPILRSVFNDMCCLANRRGHVDMDYDAIARTTRWPIETVVAKIGELMQADPNSRSPGFGGARLVLLDPNRPWGWRIVNYAKYRALQYGADDRRRAYKREKERERRARIRAKKHGQKRGQTWTKTWTKAWTSVDKRGQAWTNVDKPPSQVSNGETLRVSTVDREDIIAEAYKYTKCELKVRGNSTLTPELECSYAREEHAQVDPVLFIETASEAKKEISARILRTELRPWSYMAEQELSRRLPIPRLEIERVAWRRSLPEDGSPELADRREISETALMMYWGDEVTKANNLWDKWRCAEDET